MPGGGPSWRAGCGLVWLVWLTLSSGLWLAGEEAPIGEGPTPTFRFGFSSQVFTEVNENDVKAAVKVWAQALVSERRMVVDMQPNVFNSTEKILQALRDHQIDALVLTTPEYAVVSEEFHFDRFLPGVYGDRITEEYLLLVHRNSGIERLEDLRGRPLAQFQNVRTSLAMTWLDTLLIEAGLGDSAKHCGRVTVYTRISPAVLKVFFRQVDVCLVNRRGFETMKELNPQLGQQLRVLAASAELVPSVFCFRADFSSSVKEKLLAEITKVHLSPSGKQVMTMFQSDRLEEWPASCLESGLELLARHRRLSAATPAPEAEVRLPRSPAAKGAR